MQLTYTNMLVKLLPNKETTESGLYIPKSKDEKLEKAVVLDIGPEVKPVDIIGRTVLVHQQAVTLKYGEYRLMKQENILAVLDEDEC
jgi:co-chaperonin GroES (HSP10)